MRNRERLSYSFRNYNLLRSKLGRQFFRLSSTLKSESQDHALRACVYIYIRKHNLLSFIACCIALFEDNPQVCLERVLEDLLCLKWNPTLIRA